LKHVEPIRGTIKYQVASSWFFDSSVFTMTHGPINNEIMSLRPEEIKILLAGGANFLFHVECFFLP